MIFQGENLEEMRSLSFYTLLYYFITYQLLIAIQQLISDSHQLVLRKSCS